MVRLGNHVESHNNERVERVWICGREGFAYCCSASWGPYPVGERLPCPSAVLFVREGRRTCFHGISSDRCLVYWIRSGRMICVPSHSVIVNECTLAASSAHLGNTKILSAGALQDYHSKLSTWQSTSQYIYIPARSTLCIILDTCASVELVVQARLLVQLKPFGSRCRQDLLSPLQSFLNITEENSARGVRRELFLFTQRLKDDIERKYGLIG